MGGSAQVERACGLGGWATCCSRHRGIKFFCGGGGGVVF